MLWQHSAGEGTLSWEFGSFNSWSTFHKDLQERCVATMRATFSLELPRLCKVCSFHCLKGKRKWRRATRDVRQSGGGSVPPSLSYRFNTIPIKIPASYFDSKVYCGLLANWLRGSFPFHSPLLKLPWILKAVKVIFQVALFTPLQNINSYLKGTWNMGYFKFCRWHNRSANWVDLVNHWFISCIPPKNIWLTFL